MKKKTRPTSYFNTGPEASVCVAFLLQNQSQLIWGIKDKLKKFCSTNDMKELLIANGQEVPSGESNVRSSVLFKHSPTNMFLPDREIQRDIWRIFLSFFFFLIYQVLDCLADGMAFGALEPCKECSGQLVFKGDAYYCTGDISAWTKCVFKAAVPVRKDWVTPKVGIVLPVCLGSGRLNIKTHNSGKGARSQLDVFTLL